MSKKKKLKGPILELFQKMDSEGGIVGFIGWGGADDEISLAVKKADPKLYAAMLAVKTAIDLFEKEADKYEDYTGCEE